MHSSKYNDLIKSLPGSSWLVLLTLAVVTKRSLPGFQNIKISKFLSNANTKVNVTYMTSVFKIEDVKYRLSVAEITVMAQQFTFGLCGLLNKSKLSLVSVNCKVLQVASGSLGEEGRSLWNYCMLRI